MRLRVHSQSWIDAISMMAFVMLGTVAASPTKTKRRERALKSTRLIQTLRLAPEGAVRAARQD